jgi:hypothetical protein
MPSPLDPSSKLSTTLQSRARRVPAAVRYPLIASSIALAAFCVVRDAGPYAFFADLQAPVVRTAAGSSAHFGMLSAMLTLVVCLLPTVVFVQLLASLLGTRERDPNARS